MSSSKLAPPNELFDGAEYSVLEAPYPPFDEFWSLPPLAFPPMKSNDSTTTSVVYLFVPSLAS